MDCIETLMAEHRAILRALDALEARAERVATNDVPPIEELRTLVTFFRELADRIHHAKEEKLLFVAMHDAGFPRDRGPVPVMLHEHDVGRGHVSAMADALDAGLDGAARSRFVEHALDFARMLRAHIHKEDTILYPMARQAVRGDAWAELDAKIAAAVDRDAAASARLLDALAALEV